MNVAKIRMDSEMMENIGEDNDNSTDAEYVPEETEAL